MKNLTKKSITKNDQLDLIVEDIGKVRNKLVDTTLFVLGVLSIPPLVASLIEVKAFGWDIAKFSQIGAVTILFIFLLLRTRISFKVKANTIIGILIILGCTSLITLGLTGTGTLFLMISVVLSTLFFGSTGGKYALLVTVIPYIFISLLIIVGLIYIRIDLEVLHGKPVSWISDILLYILFSGIIIFTAGKLYKTLSNNISILKQRNRKLQEEISQRQKTEKELEVARDDALTAYQAKNEFLTNMSHEIRTPLHAINGYSDMIGKRLTDKKNKNYLESIKSSSLDLLNMITKILDLSALETGKFEANYEFIESDNCFQDIMNLFFPKAGEKGLKLVYELSDNFPTYIYMDKTRITTSISNLIDNAIKFTEAGHVQVSFEVVKSDKTDLADLKISIEDTGIGIPEEYLADHSQIFIQQDGSSNRKYEGIGIGFSMSRKLVEKMNGKMIINSQIGKGTTINILFPDVKVKYDKKVKAKPKEESSASTTISYDISQASAEIIKTSTIEPWRQLQSKQPMDKVEAFGRLVSSIGKKENVKAFTDYGDELCDAVEQYDIDRMLKLLKEYSRLLEKFQIK